MPKSIVLISLIGCFLIQCNRPEKRKREVEPNYWKERFEKLSSRFLLNTEYAETFSLSRNEIVNEKQRTIISDSLLSSGPLLFFRTTDRNCSSCVLGEIAALNGLAKKIGKDKIVLLLSSPGVNDLEIFKRVNNVQFKVSQVQQTVMDRNAIEKLNLPYYFVLTRDKVDFVFIPDKDLPEISRAYFEVIERKFVTRSVVDTIVN